MPDGTISADDYQRVVRQSAKRENIITDLQAKLAAAHETLGTITKERDTLKATAEELTAKVKGFESAPTELQAKIAELQGQLKQRDHNAAWEKAAKSFKGEKGEIIRSDALETLKRLAGQVPDGDLPDEAGYQEAIKAAVAANPIVLQAPEPQGSADARSGGRAVPVMPPGPGTHRGGAEPTAPSDPKEAALSSLKAATGRTNAFRIA